MKRLAAGCLALLPTLAGAAGGGGYVDLYYATKADLEITDTLGTREADEGKGFGLRGRIPFGTGAFFAGEYHSLEYAGFGGMPSETEANFQRFGLGAAGAQGVYGLAEVVKQKYDAAGMVTDEDGYGVHLGFASPDAGESSFYGQAGYLDVGAFGTGMEFSLGLAIPLSDAAGLVADYRRTRLEDEAGERRQHADWRVGLRFNLP